jgi:hypothetical protein
MNNNMRSEKFSFEELFSEEEALEEAKLVQENIVLDAEKAAKIFSQNREKLEALLDQRYGSHPVSPKMFFERFRFPAYVNAMMLLLIGLLIYPSYRSFVLDHQVARLQGELSLEKDRNKQKTVAPVQVEEPRMNEPAVSPSLVYPVRTERSTEEKTIRLKFSEAQKSFTLVFSVPVEEFKGYFFEISQNHQTVWQSAMPIQSGLISLNLHSGYLSRGEYTLTIYGVSGEKKTSLTTYKLLIQ